MCASTSRTTLHWMMKCVRKFFVCFFTHLYFFFFFFFLFLSFSLILILNITLILFFFFLKTIIRCFFCS